MVDRHPGTAGLRRRTLARRPVRHRRPLERRPRVPRPGVGLRSGVAAHLYAAREGYRPARLPGPVACPEAMRDFVDGRRRMANRTPTAVTKERTSDVTATARCEGAMPKIALETRTVNHSLEAAGASCTVLAWSQSQRASVVKTHSPRAKRETCDTTTKATEKRAYARVRRGRCFERRRGKPAIHATMMSACTASTEAPRICHMRRARPARAEPPHAR